MKRIYLFALFVISFVCGFGQDRFLTYTSKDSINDSPRFKASFGANIKLNGYYDVFGGLQDSETFNIGEINVFGDDDDGSFHMDMYQTQLKFESSVITENGKDVYAVVEFDFWGGNGHMRLRKAYVEFDHWQIGQTWASFGDEALWPNIMEWEGPPSGVWVRTPHIKYFNSFGNPDWRYIIALDAPINDYNKYGEIEPLVEDARQTTPDLVIGMKHEKEWGHLRMATIFRHINYKYDDVKGSFMGYGLSFSGMLKKQKNNFQFQGTIGEGITAYITSIAGYGYDGYPTSGGEMEATPSYGGWVSYEHYWTPKIHTNFVFGYTRYFTDDISRFLLVYPDDEEFAFVKGDINHQHGYGIINIMYDHFKRMTYGFELNYGRKHLDVDGLVNGVPVDNSKSRDAMRISFGFMFYF